MEWTLTTIAVLGVIIGIVSNLLPLFGSTLVNFLLAAILAGIHQGLQAMGHAGIPAWAITFIQWYFVGTFGIKLLSIVPNPIQPFAQIFAGRHI